MLLRFLWFCYEASRNQWLEPSKLKELQEKKLKAILRHAYENVPLYHEKFDSVGLKPDDVRTLDDLQKLPFTTKQEIREGIPDRSIAKGYDIENCVKRSTSGTSGGPMPVYYSKKQWDHTNARKYRRMRTYGFKLGDRLLDIYYGVQEPPIPTRREEGSDRPKRKSRGRETFGPALSLVRRWTRTAFIGYRGDEVISDIIDFRPQFIYANASYLRLIAEAIKDKGLEEKIRPKGLVSWGEVLDEPTREYLESSYRCPLYNEYGMIEVGGIALECPTRKGFHINADNVVLEVIRDGKTVSAGEQGEIVVTGLNNYMMPMIRYRVGDVGVLDDYRCSCGRSFPLLKSVEGRIVDCFILADGQIVTPKAIMTAVQSTLGVSRYQMVQENERKFTIELMRKESDPEVSIDELKEKCHKILGNDVEVNVFSGDRKNLRAKFRPVISKLTVSGEPRWTVPRR